MKRNSVLYKYFVTYTAIILAMCISASFLFFFLARSQYNDNVDASNISRFTASKEVLDGNFEECVRIASKLLTNENGALDNTSSSKTVNPVEINRVLRGYMTGHSDFLDIVMIPDMEKNSEATYYCATGSIDFKYFDNYYGFDKINHKWIAENIGNISAPLLIQVSCLLRR